VLGVPEYVWSLSDCNATATTTPDCADQETFVEDTTGDMTDEVLFSLEIVQGTKIVYDTGTQDYGPNPFGLTAAEYPVTWINYNPLNLGDMGIATGPNNGNCYGSSNYPEAQASYAGFYTVTAKKTCVPAVSGLATGTATIELATATYTKSTSATTCAPAGVNPCWTVKWVSKYKKIEKFTIWLQ